MTPWKHAQSSANKFGGAANDYIDIHDWLDCTKQYTGDWTHRALRHHAAGVQWAIEKFGHARMNCDRKMIPVKSIAEQHIEEDCGRIPTVADWFVTMAEHPADWMLKVKTTTTEELAIAE